jgi:lysophospholipase L1-like esterase
MRRFHCWGALFVCLLALVAGLTPTYANDPPPDPSVVPPGYAPRGLGTTYLALGDSLVLGTEEPSNNDNLPGYPDTLFHYFRAISPGLTLVKLGVDGETSTSMITSTTTFTSQLALAEQFIVAERAAGRRVGMVTLDIGGNDMIDVLLSSGGDAPAALETFRSNLRIILDRLLAALTVNNVRDGDLVLMDYYNPYPGLKQVFPTLPVDPDEWVPRFNAAIKELAAERGLAVAEVAQAFVGREVEYIYVQRPYFPAPIPSAYDYHPRPPGHHAIASNFFAVSGYKQSAYLALVVKE